MTNLHRVLLASLLLGAVYCLLAPAVLAWQLPSGLTEAQRQAADENAKLFLTYNYTETKDMCKQFLTLCSAVLVASLTFSEKIIKFESATTRARRLVIGAWLLLLLAIITCGIGLTLITLAGGAAVYDKYHPDNYLHTAALAYVGIIAAGVCFVGGLLLLIGAVVSATFFQHPAPAVAAAAPSDAKIDATTSDVPKTGSTEPTT